MTKYPKWSTKQSRLDLNRANRNSWSLHTTQRPLANRTSRAEIQVNSWAVIFLEEDESFSYHKSALPKGLHGAFSTSHKGLMWVGEGPRLRNTNHLNTKDATASSRIFPCFWHPGNFIILLSPLNLFWFIYVTPVRLRFVVLLNTLKLRL